MLNRNFYRMMLVAAFAVATYGLLGQTAAAQGKQPVKIHLDHWQNGGTVQTAAKWVDGNLHKTNSTYGEGDFIPTRFVIDNLPPGTYSLTFEWLAAKAQGAPGADRVKHAHDYLATYNQGANSGKANNGYGLHPNPCANRVQGNTVIAGCSGSVSGDSQQPVPTDPYLCGGGFIFNGGACRAQAAGEFRMWNATLTAVSGYSYNPPGTNPASQPNFQETTTNKLTVINFIVAGPGNKDVVLALGARLAVKSEWDSTVDPDLNPNGEKDGACDINGAPYHWAYQLVDAEGNNLQSGNRDRSIMCKNEGGGGGTITVAKRCFVGTTEVFEDPFGAQIPFVFSSPSFGSLIGNDGDNFFDVNCGSSASPGTVPTGIHTVTELQGPPTHPSFGWELRNISCVGTNNGGNASTYKYLNGATIAFEPGDRTAEINLRSNDNVTCTFFNHQAEMPIHKLVSGGYATCSDANGIANTVPDPNFGFLDYGFRPCRYPNGLTLQAGDPRFTFNLFFASGDTVNDRPVAPTTFPGPPAVALSSVVIPPRFDAPGIIGIPLTACEEPSGTHTMSSVTVRVTDGQGTLDPSDDTTTTITLPIYEILLPVAVNGFVLSPFGAHVFPQGTHACFNFRLPSNTVRFEFAIDNRPGQRTLGYWKNWSSCSGGGQTRDKAEAGFWLDDRLPLYIGVNNVVADTCTEAVRLLDKTDAVLNGDNGRPLNRASDAAYNMAAQLLAAMANVGAGAGTCAVATSAIADAQALLVEIGFIGTGSYVTNSTDPHWAYANALATLLDRYNNMTHDGLTCSSLPALPVHVHP